jgi:predicted oxidoreductase
VNRSIEAGIIKKADTIEELADKLGLNKGILGNAVKDWNGVCAKGEDVGYNYDPEFLVPIAKAPFYGIRIGAQICGTLCGAQVNDELQVIDKEGLPVKGLYAGTATCGGTAGISYGVAGSWSGGYICAESLIKSAKKNA